MIKISRLLIIITCLFYYKSYSQTEKGNLLLGGSMGFAKSKVDQPFYEYYKTFNLNFNPNISYLIFDRLAVGVIIPVAYNMSESKSDFGLNESNSTQYSLGPKIRYYFNFGKLALFPEISYSFGKSKTTMPLFNSQSGQLENYTIKTDLTNFSSGLGLTYFLNKNIGIEALLFYSKQSNKIHSYSAYQTEST